MLLYLVPTGHTHAPEGESMNVSVHSRHKLSDLHSVHGNGHSVKRSVREGLKKKERRLLFNILVIKSVVWLLLVFSLH